MNNFHLESQKSMFYKMVTSSSSSSLSLLILNKEGNWNSFLGGLMAFRFRYFFRGFWFIPQSLSWYQLLTAFAQKLLMLDQILLFEVRSDCSQIGSFSNLFLQSSSDWGFVFKWVQQLPHLQWCVDEVVIILHCIHNKADILVNNRLNCDSQWDFKDLCKVIKNLW